MSSADHALRMEELVRTRNTRRLGLVALCLIVLAGLALRMTGIGFLLPQVPEPDGVVIDQQVLRLRGDDRLEAPAFVAAFYPTLVAHVAACMPRPATSGGGMSGTETLTLAQHLDRASEYRRDIRITVALLSLLALSGTWWLARRFVTDAWALAAALLVATSVFHIWFAQQARPHAPEASFALLAVVAGLRLRERGGWMAYVLAGIASGLAIGCLQNGLAVLPALLVAVVLRARAERSLRRSALDTTTTAERVGGVGPDDHEISPVKRAILGSVIGLVIVGIAVRIFYPFVFDVPKRAEIGTDGSTLSLSGHRIDLSMFNGRGFATVARSLWEYDPLIAGLCVLGLVIALVDFARKRSSSDSSGRRDALWIVLAFVVPYTIAIGLYQRTYQRFALPLVPFECVLAVFGLMRCANAAKSAGVGPHRIALTTASFLFAVQAYAAWKLVHVRAQPDTITQSAEWIESHVPRDARVSMMTALDLPLLQSATARNANFPLMNDLVYPWFNYQWRLPESELEGRGFDLRSMPLVTEGMRQAARADLDGFVSAQQAQWTVIEVYTPDRRALPAALRSVIAAHGELAVRLSPDEVDTGENLPIVYQDDEFPYTTPWFARVLGARCVGPVIEIYKMR